MKVTREPTGTVTLRGETPADVMVMVAAPDTVGDGAVGVAAPLSDPPPLQAAVISSAAKALP
jgi:hypothetical protein